MVGKVFIHFLMICFDSELFSQNFVWQLNNDQKSLEPHRNCQIKSSKWLYFSFHMSQRIDNIQFYSYESIFLTNFKCSKHFALKKSSELWHSSSSRKGRPRIAPFQYYSSKDHENIYLFYFVRTISFASSKFLENNHKVLITYFHQSEDLILISFSMHPLLVNSFPAVLLYSVAIYFKSRNFCRIQFKLNFKVHLLQQYGMNWIT